MWTDEVRGSDRLLGTSSGGACGGGPGGGGRGGGGGEGEEVEAWLG